MWLKQLLVTVLGITVIWTMAPVAARSIHAAAPAGPVAVTIPRVIRFRVIANSDNPVDQAIKLDIRDHILETLDPELDGLKNRRVAMERIESLRGRLEQVANQVLIAHHVDYRARILWTRTIFPTKAYGSWVLPAGRYQALLVVLGKGEGHNWWCVLFPSLCFIDMGNALAVPTSVAVSTPTTPVAPLHVSLRHARRARRPLGRIRVSWTSPRFFTTFLAILRK